MEHVKFYLPKTIDEKFDMLKTWMEEFVKINIETFKLEVNKNELVLFNLKENENVILTKSETKSIDLKQSIFTYSIKHSIKLIL